jgi:hypothetical protein
VVVRWAALRLWRDPLRHHKNHKKHVTLPGNGANFTPPGVDLLPAIKDRTTQKEQDMMETITQNCGLYLAQKLAKAYEAQHPRWRRLLLRVNGPYQNRRVRAPKDLRQLRLQSR